MYELGNWLLKKWFEKVVYVVGNWLLKKWFEKVVYVVGWVVVSFWVFWFVIALMTAGNS